MIKEVTFSIRLMYSRNLRACAWDVTRETFSFPVHVHKMYRISNLSLVYVRPVEHSTIVRSAHTLYLCVLCGSQNKQRLFPYTTLTDWFV